MTKERMAGLICDNHLAAINTRPPSDVCDLLTTMVQSLNNYLSLMDERKHEGTPLVNYTPAYPGVCRIRKLDTALPASSTCLVPPTSQETQKWAK